MNRLSLLLATLLFVDTGAVFGQESAATQFELMRGLRDKGYFDLATEQLAKLQALKSPELDGVLPLESARLQLAIAKEKAPEQRGPYFSQARKDLEAYAKVHAGKPQEAQARLELARLISYQAEATLSKAMREPSTAAQQEQAKPAEKQYIQAGGELEQAAKAIKDIAESYKNADAAEEKRVRQDLTKEYWRARMDRAANYIDQARTYIDLGKTAVNLARTDKIKNAKDAFEAIVLETKDLATQYLAMAWLGKCYIEMDTPDKALKYLSSVIYARDREAQAGQRWARYFDIQWAPTNVKIADKDKKNYVQKSAYSWLKDYPTHLKSTEGQGVQFELAESLYREANGLWQTAIQKATATVKDKEKAKELAKTIPPPKAAVQLFEKAQKLYENVAAGDSDFAERASQQSVGIAFQKMGESTPLESLRDFGECFLKAQFELMKMNQARQRAEKDPGKAAVYEKERVERLKQAARALRRALRMANSRTPPSKVDEARFFLTTAYLFSGDRERAAVMGEFLARQTPPTKRASFGAGYALEAYASILNRENTAENRRRLIDLATFVLTPESQKAWADDPVTSVARFQLAMTYLKDQDAAGRKPYPQAIEQLEKLPETFAGYLLAQAQLVFISLEAREQSDIGPERKEYYSKVARTALARIKELPTDPDPSTATMYFAAKLEQAKFLYEDASNLIAKKQLAPAGKKYEEMAKYLEGLKTQFDKNPALVLPDSREGLEYSQNVLKKYATFGMAEVAYRQGNYKQVLDPTRTGTVLKSILAMKPDGTGKIRLKDFQVTTELLGLALRAQVQMGKIPDARATLKTMEMLAGEAGDIGAGMTNVLRELVVDLQTQVRELKAAGDAKKLKETVSNFSTFLDDLAAKKGANAGDLVFLASCFSSLEQYERAANLFQKLSPPKVLDAPPKTKFSEAEETELYTYWRIQIEYAKTLRLGKGDLKKANAALETLLNHNHGRFHLMAKIEKLQVYEDLGLYGLAIEGWKEVMNDRYVKERLADNNKQGLLFNKQAKEVYFDAYYHYGNAVYRYGQAPAGKKAGLTARYTEFAAKHLLRLKNASSQEGWNLVEPQFNALKAAEAPFREAFDALEKAEKAEKK